MKVILLSDVKNVGKANEVVNDILRKRDSYIKDVLCLVCFRFLLKGGRP